MLIPLISLSKGISQISVFLLEATFAAAKNEVDVKEGGGRGSDLNIQLTIAEKK